MLKFDLIFVPWGSPFKAKLDINNFRTIGFNGPVAMYVRLLWLIVANNIKSVYCNEAGHIRYIILLARMFPRIKFVVHVRIIEDTTRIRKSFSNLHFLAISKVINNELSQPSQLFYDGYNFSELRSWKKAPSGICKIGIIGRITESKGIGIFTKQFFDSCGLDIEFHFFGDIDKYYEKSKVIQLLKGLNNVHFHGFIEDKSSIYSCIDVVVHVNEYEALGRIFFESLDFGIPFLGINRGGIAEIAHQINYPYVFHKDELHNLLYSFSTKEWEFNYQQLEISRKLALNNFSVEKYTTILNRLLT